MTNLNSTIFTTLKPLIASEDIIMELAIDIVPTDQLQKFSLSLHNATVNQIDFYSRTKGNTKDVQQTKGYYRDLLTYIDSINEHDNNLSLVLNNLLSHIEVALETQGYHFKGYTACDNLVDKVTIDTESNLGFLLSLDVLSMTAELNIACLPLISNEDDPNKHIVVTFPFFNGILWFTKGEH